MENDGNGMEIPFGKLRAGGAVYWNLVQRALYFLFLIRPTRAIIEVQAQFVSSLFIKEQRSF